MHIHFSSNEARALNTLFSDEPVELDDLSRDEIRVQAAELLSIKRKEDPKNNVMWAQVAHELRKFLDDRVLH